MDEREVVLFGANDLKRLFGVDVKYSVYGWTQPCELTPEVDTGYVFPPELTALFLLGLTECDPIMLSGPPGSGKTTLALQIAARLNYGVLRLQHHEMTEAAEVMGEYVLVGGATEFIYGPLPEAMVNGHLLVLDEWDMASPGVQSIYHGPLERMGGYGGKLARLGSLLLAKKGGNEVVRAHARFRVVATGNTTGQGDSTGNYAGTQVQNQALVGRFLTRLNADYLPAALEERVLCKQLAIPAVMAASLVKAANLMRDAYANGKLSVGCSLRDLLNWGRKRQQLGSYQKAAMVAMGNTMAQEERSVLEEIVQRAFGEDAKAVNNG